MLCFPLILQNSERSLEVPGRSSEGLWEALGNLSKGPLQIPERSPKSLEGPKEIPGGSLEGPWGGSPEVPGGSLESLEVPGGSSERPWRPQGFPEVPDSSLDVPEGSLEGLLITKCLVFQGI